MCNAAKVRVLAFLFFLTYNYYAHCLKIIPERSEIVFTNKSYVTNVSLNVRRTRRGGDYVANMEATIEVSLGNNVTVDLVFYEYLHNEYRRSFVELHYKLCDLIEKDPYFGYVLRSSGWVKCPIHRGFRLSLRNVNFTVNIPSVWPFEKGKGELTATDNTNGAMIARGNIVLTFKQK